jgi:uncharacterized protein (DUF4415 family)
MKEEYDFSEAKRGAGVPMAPGKTRVTIALDDEVLEWFRAQVHKRGGGDYQALINTALREYISRSGEPLEQMLRQGDTRRNRPACVSHNGFG